jgi:hypothetical protein
MNSVNQVSVVGQGNRNLKTLASGGQSTSVLSKKEYGLAYGLKGAALNTAHYEYKKEAFLADAKAFGAGLLTGEIGVTRHGTNKDGSRGSISWVKMNTLKEPKAKEINLAEVITEENAGDAIEMLRKLGFNITLGAK